jgi:hypothetical protein
MSIRRKAGALLFCGNLEITDAQVRAQLQLCG